MYLVSNRMMSIMGSGNTSLSCEGLDACKSKQERMVYLAQFYLQESDVKLTELDYENLKDVCYILTPDKANPRERLRQMKELLQKMKETPSQIPSILNKILYN